MKLEELHEGRGWAADMARENRERHRKAREAAKAEEKAYLAAQRAKEKAAQPKKLTIDQIYHKVVDATSESFPDGEPLLGNWMRKHDLEMSDIDRAFKKKEGVDYHGYMVRLWDEHADQALHDVKYEHPWLFHKSKDQIIKSALLAVKNEDTARAHIIINMARKEGKNYPEFAAIEKSIGPDKGENNVWSHTPFIDFDHKTYTFKKTANPWK